MGVGYISLRRRNRCEKEKDHDRMVPSESEKGRRNLMCPQKEWAKVINRENSSITLGDSGVYEIVN